MTRHQWTDRDTNRTADELATMLAAAHHRLNELGYPRATIRHDDETPLPQSDRRCPDPAVTQPDTMQRVEHEPSTQRNT